MSRFREAVASLPATRAAWHTIKSLPGQMMGLPRIDYGGVTEGLIRSCVGKSDPIVLEIGCNEGQTTLWFLEMFDNPTIYCFEPDPRAIARFRERVGDRPNVTLLEMAVSDRTGTIDFYQSGGRRDNEWLVKAMPEGWDLSGSIRQPYRHLAVYPLVTFDQQIEVPTATLDSVCEAHDIGPVDFIWLDVQGAELDVFRGAAQTLARTRLLYTEYSNRELYRGQRGLRDMVKHLKGFSLLARYPEDALLRNDELSV
jgi:FkbM family methyltransferase